MPSRNITFDLDAGAPKAANLTIYTGSDFSATFNVVGLSNSPFNFENWTGSSQMQKSAGNWCNYSSNRNIHGWIY